MSENLEVTKDEASIIFKPIALAVFFICLLASIWFQLYTMIGILSFVLVLAAFIFVWNKMSIKHVDVQLDLPVSRVFTGDTFRVNTTVKNDKWIPLVWLDVLFQESDLVSWQDKAFYIVRFMWLLSYQDIVWKVTGEAKHRGVYEVGNITAKSGDGFRFMESEQKYNLHEKMYIYPKLVSVRVPPFRPQMQWEVQGKAGGLLEDPLMVSGVREYEPGDDWKRFNWWASARTGKMQTNVYQPIVAKKIMIFVDVHGFVASETYEDEEKQKKYEREMKENFESFLSVIASFSVAYGEQGIQVGYGSNALNYFNEPQQIIQPTTEMTHLLDSLAQITKRTFGQVGEIVTTGRNASPLYIFCQSITESHLKLFEETKNIQDITFYYRIENALVEKLERSALSVEQLLTGGEER